MWQQVLHLTVYLIKLYIFQTGMGYVKNEKNLNTQISDNQKLGTYKKKYKPHETVDPITAGVKPA